MLGIAHRKCYRWREIADWRETKARGIPVRGGGYTGRIGPTHVAIEALRHMFYAIGWLTPISPPLVK